MSESNLYSFNTDEILGKIYGGTSCDGCKRGRSHHPLPTPGLGKSSNILFNLGLEENFKHPRLDYFLSCTRPLLEHILKKQKKSLSSEPRVNRDKAGLIMKIIAGTNLGKILIALAQSPPHNWTLIHDAALNPSISTRDPTAAAVGTDTVPIPNISSYYGPYHVGEDEIDPESCEVFLLKPYNGGCSRFLGSQCDHLALAITHIVGDPHNSLLHETNISRIVSKWQSLSRADLAKNEGVTDKETLHKYMLKMFRGDVPEASISRESASHVAPGTSYEATEENASGTFNFISHSICNSSDRVAVMVTFKSVSLLILCYGGDYPEYHILDDKVIEVVDRHTPLQFMVRCVLNSEAAVF
jgi:hypothetical protein